MLNLMQYLSFNFFTGIIKIVQGIKDYSGLQVKPQFTNQKLGLNRRSWFSIEFAKAYNLNIAYCPQKNPPPYNTKK